MAKQEFVVTDGDREIARSGVTIQAEAAGLDITDPAVQTFMENRIAVAAQESAHVRWLYSLLDERGEQ